jgi:hypothetical protein
MADSILQLPPAQHIFAEFDKPLVVNNLHNLGISVQLIILDNHAWVQARLPP